LIKIAIVGCGKIADAHAAQIRRINGCQIIGVCDSEELMAHQLAERWDIDVYFDDLGRLLQRTRPDVVHVTTPPRSHFAIAQQCLEHGCHVYIEKPFTVDSREAEDLIALAERLRLKLTVGHDAQFSPAARRLRALVRDGYLGNAPVHMESYYGYHLDDATYARAFLGNAEHWVRKLPGGLLQNLISHGIARIAEFLSADAPRVIAHAFVSPRLKALGYDVHDELRVIVIDDRNTTASFTFSSSMRPLLHQFRVFGSRNGLALDENQQTVVMLRGRPFKSYAERFLPPVLFAKQYLANATRNVGLFLSNDFHMDAGKKELMAAFYRSISKGTPPPLSYREILLTSRIMDAIFEQVGQSSALCAGSAGRPE
jgi:predicted dehydrogenase